MERQRGRSHAEHSAALKENREAGVFCVRQPTLRLRYGSLRTRVR